MEKRAQPERVFDILEKGGGDEAATKRPQSACVHFGTKP